MKIIFFIFITLLSSLSGCAQTRLAQFDMINYTAPVGWDKSEKPGTLSFSKENEMGYCVITVYQGIQTTPDAQKNFDLSWEALVKDNLGGGKATMQPASSDNGWESHVGSAMFQKEDLNGVAVLISSSKNSKTVNILAITNTDAFVKEMEVFLDGIIMKAGVEPDNLIENETTITVEKSNTTQSPKIEIWMGLKTPSVNIYSNTDGDDWADLCWLIVLPNGDFINQLPFEGFSDFSRNRTGVTWGKFVMNGSKGSFTNPYDTIKVNKISETVLERTGYTYRLYKAVPVDGVKLSGQYVNGIPNWSTITNYPYGPNDAQPKIEFKSNGTFKDMGAFVTNFSMPNREPERAPGSGTYEIKNFTLILNYNDGRIVTKSFSGINDKPVTATSGMVYISGNPFYNK